jgi:spore germination protein GerM
MSRYARFALSGLVLLAAVGVFPATTRTVAQDPDLTHKAALPMVAADSAPGATSSFAAYFFMASVGEDEGGPFLVPVHREVPHTLAVGAAAVNALLAGPTPAEASSVPAISSTVPPGSELLGLSISGGIATADLSSEFESGGGSASVLGRLAQLTYTLTQFPTVDSVRLLIEGEEVTEFSSEGVVIDGPLTRVDFEDFLPAIFVDSPHYLGPAGNPLHMVGNANVFEAQFMATIVNNDGLIIAEVPVMASCGTGCRGTFDVTIPYNVTSSQPGALIVWDASAQDGSQENIREYPVLLTPP